MHSQGGTCRFPVLARASLICLRLVGLWFEAHTCLLPHKTIEANHESPKP